MPDDVIGENREGIAAALAAGYQHLERGGTALDAVEAAVAAMEDHEAFDAGRGSFLTNDGRVQLDALLMNGEDLRAGGVACVERLRNPVRAARLVLEKSPHVYFVGVGAERFARQHGMPLIDNTELIIPRERERLMAFQQAELLGAKDTTFSGPLHLDKEPEDETLPILRQQAEVMLQTGVIGTTRQSTRTIPSARSRWIFMATSLRRPARGAPCRRLRGAWAIRR